MITFIPARLPKIEYNCYRLFPPRQQYKGSMNMPSTKMAISMVPTAVTSPNVLPPRDQSIVGSLSSSKLANLDPTMTIIGQGTYKTKGNLLLRKLVQAQSVVYGNTKLQTEKTDIATSIVLAIRDHTNGFFTS
jgi:hypothetical protein